ncbi:DmpA family aminopeptidase [Ornithinimicrobium avium]|uniref:DmpA family aminopeptidase n=1 Tax=Ornithinimicrobium avium TaxID=2283195 RepID=UPI0022770AB7|nr:P1 family peptidase [Ornithinimicrobium avium]
MTDVPGVEVGYVTLVEGSGPLRVGAGPVRTGVTAILPRGRDGVGMPCAAGWHSLNGNGEMTGTTWISETGALSLPVLITNTHAIGPCHRGVIDWVVANRPEAATGWLLPVVAETYDGYLNDINGSHVTAAHAVQAIDDAAPGPVEEGSVGGGTGMNCYAFKAGSGTASRLVHHGGDRYTVGAFVQANFGRRHELVVAGQQVGDALGVENPMDEAHQAVPPGAGSVIVVVATDAPLLPGQCEALARRVPLGLARTGTTGSHFSGDIFLALSTANPGALGSTKSADGTEGYDELRFIQWGSIDPLYETVVTSVEEAVLNALIANDTTVGRDDHRSPALPHDPLTDLLTERGVALAPLR